MLFSSSYTDRAYNPTKLDRLINIIDGFFWNKIVFPIVWLYVMITIKKEKMGDHKIMEIKKINTVRVIKEFPGFKVNDVLKLDNKVGLFKYVYNDNEETTEDAFVALFDDLAVHHASLSKKVVVDNLGTYFEDASEYSMRSREEVELRIAEYEHALRELDEGKDGILQGMKEKEARTAWQNLIWENEWFLGRRE